MDAELGRSPSGEVEEARASPGSRPVTESSSAAEPLTGPSTSSRHEEFTWPPGHRLFAVFDSKSAAADAVDRLRSSGASAKEDEVWVFEGPEGLRELDATGSRHGARGRIVRFLEMAMAPNDLDYLQLLTEELEEGHVVLAIRVEGGPGRADEIARLLRERGGRSMRYATHWDFVPLLR